MLEIVDKEYYGEVIKFAVSKRLMDDLNKELMYLHLYGTDWDDPGLTKTRLFKDFAPMSFFFQMGRRQEDGTYKDWFVGGLIFHGPHDRGGDGGSPTYSVELNPGTKPHWSVHT